MVKIAYKYYLKFPPFVRESIDLSLSGLMGGINIDYYRPSVENILMGCDEFINDKLTVLK